MVSKKSLFIPVIAIALLVIASVSVAAVLMFNLLPRDHTEISCTRPLEIGLKTFTFSKNKVIFKVYDHNANTLLWTSPQQQVQSPFVDVSLNTNIMNPPPLIRVDMINVKNNVLLSSILLEPDCDLVVAEPTFIFPPPNGCKLIINPPKDPPPISCGDSVVQFPPETCDPPSSPCIDPFTGQPSICDMSCQCLPPNGGGGGGGHKTTEWPTPAVAVDLSKDIGKTATVIVRDTYGNTLAQSPPMTIDTEILSMNLVSVNPIPISSFFDVFYELKIDNIPKTKAKCTVINGAALESLFPTTTTTTTTTIPGCATHADCNDNNQCTQDLCSSGVCSNPSAPNGQACNDGQFCTVNDVCVSGNCIGGQPLNCDDGIACTTDSCDEVSDFCTHAAVDLGTQTCGTGACQVTVPRCAFGTPVTCTPGTPSAEVCANGIDDDCDGLVDEGPCI